MKLLLGRPVADIILNHLKDEISLHAEKPALAVILVGDDPASHLYVKLKEKKALEIGMNFFRYDFSFTDSQETVLKQIEKINNDENIHGVIVQLPLPAGFDTQKIISAIDPKKDVDGFHSVNAEIFLSGSNSIFPVFPSAIMKLIESCGVNLKEKRGIVIANSTSFGEIMCEMLKRNGLFSEYILAENIQSQLGKIKDFEVVISAVGSPGLLSGEMFKSGSIIVDGGIEKVGNVVLGDVDFASVEALDGFITPVPGGVGPVTIACLLQNVYLAFKAQQKEK